MKGVFPMKKLWIVLFVCLLCGCADTAAPQTQKAPPEEPPAPALHLRIVDGAGTDELFLAGEKSCEVYVLPLNDIDIYLDEEAADKSALEDGMPIELTYTSVEETLPARLSASALYAWSLGTAENPGGGYYDLCGLYLQVLEDLWAEGEGMNENIDFVSFDLSDAPGGLTAGEKSAIAFRFAAQHGLVAMEMSYEELLNEGMIADAEDFPHLERGLLFSIKTAEDEGVYSLPVIHFTAEKWRTPLGAFFFGDCSAAWPACGTWSEYNVGGYMIA